MPPLGYCTHALVDGKKVKVAHTRLPSVGFRSRSRFLAVSLLVTWVINPAVGAITFRQACSYPKEGCYQFRCLVNRGTMGVNSFPKTVTRQRRGCDLNPSPSEPEFSTLTTRLPCHPTGGWTNRKHIPLRSIWRAAETWKRRHENMLLENQCVPHSHCSLLLNSLEPVTVKFFVNHDLLPWPAR